MSVQQSFSTLQDTAGLLFNLSVQRVFGLALDFSFLVLAGAVTLISRVTGIKSVTA